MHISLGAPGSTPRKVQEFSATAPPSDIPRASPPPRRGGPAPAIHLSTPQREDSSKRRQARYAEFSELGGLTATATHSKAPAATRRPKTSRNVPNPTPDSFSDYVVRSPPNARRGGGGSADVWPSPPPPPLYSTAVAADERSRSAAAPAWQPEPPLRRSDLSSDAPDWLPLASASSSPSEFAEFGRKLLGLALST
jgi:hypothetical protein